MIGYGSAAGSELVLPNNCTFGTTARNLLRSGVQPVDLLCSEGKQLELVAPFKGNMDVAALDALLKEKVRRARHKVVRESRAPRSPAGGVLSPIAG